MGVKREKGGRKGVVGNLHSTDKERPGGRARLGASEGLKIQWPEEAGKMLRAQCLQSPGCGEDGTLSWGSREPWQDCWRRGHEQTSGAEGSLASGLLYSSAGDGLGSRSCGRHRQDLLL